VAAATVSVTGAGSTNLATGNYRVAYTWIDYLTNAETSLGGSESAQFAVTNGGSVPVVTIPALPAWASSANIYLTPANGASGSEVQYLTGITVTTINLTNANTGTVTPPNTSRILNMTLAVASLASGHPTSSAYQWPTPWTRQAILEYFRHFIKYTSSNGQYGQNLNACTSYNAQPSQGPGFVPELICYEGSLQQLAPGNISTISGGAMQPEADGGFLSNRLTHDLWYDPEVYWCDMALMGAAQQGGVSLMNCLSLCLPFTGSGGAQAGVLIWAYSVWAGQTWGRGNGTTAGNGLSITNLFWADTLSAQHLNNAAVRLQAWRDWADAANQSQVQYGNSLPVFGLGSSLILTSGMEAGMPGPGPGSILLESGAHILLENGFRVLLESAVGPATQIALTGPSTATVGVASTNFTVNPNGTYTGIVSLADGGHGGTFHPPSLTFSGSSAAQTFTYTPANVGTFPISIFPTVPITTIGSPIQVACSSPSATTATLSGPIVGFVNRGLTYTINLNGTYTGRITPSDGSSGGTFTPSFLTWNGTGQTQTFGYTPFAPGVAPISISANPTLVYSNSPIVLTVAPAVGYALTGPANGTVYFDQTFTLTPAGFIDYDWITLSDGGAGGIFRQNIVFVNNSFPVNFNYNPRKTGTITITATSSKGGAISGSPFTFTCNAYVNPNIATPYSQHMYNPSGNN
jgi:hypothetical protein